MEKTMKGLKVGLMIGLITLMASPAFARSISLKDGWDRSLDLHHHRSDYCSSSVDPGSHSLLQLHWYCNDDGSQEREEG